MSQSPLHYSQQQQQQQKQLRSFSGLAILQSPSVIHYPSFTFNNEGQPPTTSHHYVRSVLRCLLYPCLVCFRPQLSTSTQPPSDFILFHPILRRYVKHATLIERCFPLEKSGETTPNSNELSYLEYYAQTKPAKLTKVGAYLTKRISRDIQRRRRTDVLVGLRIYDSLLVACTRDLNFFAKDVLETLNAALVAGELDFSLAATRTFALFCRNHTGSTLAIDKGLRELYIRLLRIYVSYLDTNSSKQGQEKMAGLGLCALQAVAESHATYAPDCYYELPSVVDALVAHISAHQPSLDTTTALLTEESSMPTTEERIAQIEELCKEQGPSVNSGRQLAQWTWHCLETLVHRSHAQHSRAIVSQIFKYLDTSLKWQPVALCVTIVTMVIGQLQPQDQNMVVVETLAFLTGGTSSSSQLYLENIPRTGTSLMLEGITQGSSLSEDAAAEDVKATSRRACIIRILENLFSQPPYVLVGISVMEALNILVSFLLESVASESNLQRSDYRLFSTFLKRCSLSSNKSTVAEDGQPGTLADYYHLLSAIGGLAKHQYYTEQLPDILRFLVAQMNLGCDASTQQDCSVEVGQERQLWLLQTLSIVMQSNRYRKGQFDSRSTKRSTSGSTVSLAPGVFAPLFVLLSHERTDIRLQAADCVIDIFHHNANHLSQTDALSNSISLRWGTELATAMYKKLSMSLKQNQQLASYAAAAGILHGLVTLLFNRSTAECTLAVIDKCSPQNPSMYWLTLKIMVVSRMVEMGADSNTDLEKLVQEANKEAERAGVWAAEISEACRCNERVAALALLSESDQGSQSKEASIIESIGAKLDSKEILALLFSQGQETTDDSQLDTVVESEFIVDRILCNAGAADTRGGNSVLEPLSAVSQTSSGNDRSRISIDWEDGLLDTLDKEQDSKMEEDHSPQQIKVEHLRSVLRNGLRMNSNDRLSTVWTPLSVESTNIRRRRCSSPPPISGNEEQNPNEVSELLASIADYSDGSQTMLTNTSKVHPQAAVTVTEGNSSPSISTTPVIGHFD